MDKQQWDDNSLCSSYEKQDSDETLEESEEDQEGGKGHEGDNLVEEILHHPTRRTKTDNLQYPKPEENDEDGKARKRNGNPSKESDRSKVKRF
jgi:hypothetical protein